MLPGDHEAEQAGSAERGTLLVGELPVAVAFRGADPELVAEPFRGPDRVVQAGPVELRVGAFGGGHGGVLSVRPFATSMRTPPARRPIRIPDRTIPKTY